MISRGNTAKAGRRGALFSRRPRPHPGAFSSQPMLLRHGVGRKKFPLSLSLIKIREA